MRFPRFSSILTLIALSFAPYWLAAQTLRQNSASRPGGASAQGELTVTVTVVASVGIVIGEDGQPRLMVANAADPRDNVSSIRKVVLTPVAPDSETPKSKLTPGLKPKEF